MSRYPKHLRDQHAAEDEANIQRAIQDNETRYPDDRSKEYKAPAGGDHQRLRGIPAIGPGVTGAIHGTSPHHRHR